MTLNNKLIIVKLFIICNFFVILVKLLPEIDVIKYGQHFGFIQQKLLTKFLKISQHNAAKKCVFNKNVFINFL